MIFAFVMCRIGLVLKDVNVQIGIQQEKLRESREKACVLENEIKKKNVHHMHPSNVVLLHPCDRNDVPVKKN